VSTEAKAPGNCDAGPLDAEATACFTRLLERYLHYRIGGDGTEGKAMTGDEVREVFEAMLPQQELDRLCTPFGVIARERKLNLGMCVRAMVISAGTPGGAYQADVLRSYLECEVPHVARSAF